MDYIYDYGFIQEILFSHFLRRRKCFCVYLIPFKNIHVLQWAHIQWAFCFCCRGTDLPTDHINSLAQSYCSLYLQAFSDQREKKSLKYLLHVENEILQLFQCILNKSFHSLNSQRTKINSTIASCPLDEILLIKLIIPLVNKHHTLGDFHSK